MSVQLWESPSKSTDLVGEDVKVDRYYIRQGNEQFDSITFIVHEIDGKVLKKKLRFWVKLDEALTLDFKYL